MAGRLQDKVALITGGARGQGAAEGALFAAEGAAVVLADVLDREGHDAAESMGGSYKHLDVTDEDAWRALIGEVLSEHRRLDVLVNNAGIYINAPLTQMPLDDYRRVIDVNQVGVFLGMKHAAPAMGESGGGSIVNISSIAGLRGSAGSIAYGASKWAVRGMTKTAAHDLAPLGIRVNSIHPGAIDTAMLQQVPAAEAGLERLVRRVPLQRVAEPEEVARLALFLASDESSYCTGAEFVIDGGTMA
jgi:3alpha(or 20beta)-hydroxysteroid dehydrogenase